MGGFGVGLELICVECDGMWLREFWSRLGLVLEHFPKPPNLAHNSCNNIPKAALKAPFYQQHSQQQIPQLKPDPNKPDCLPIRANRQGMLPALRKTSLRHKPALGETSLSTPENLNIRGMNMCVLIFLLSFFWGGESVSLLDTCSHFCPVGLSIWKNMG